MTPEEVILRILDAFSERKLQDNATVFLSYSVEINTEEIERLARQTSWLNFPHEVLCDNPEALAFMTPEAFAWLLPACLIASITLYDDSNALTTSVITCLTPPDDADEDQFETLVEEMRLLGIDMQEDEVRSTLGADEEMLQLFMDRVNVLNKNETVAVLDYLTYIDTTHGHDYPVFGPKDAINRYWANAGSTNNQL